MKKVEVTNFTGGLSAVLTKCAEGGGGAPKYPSWPKRLVRCQGGCPVTVTHTESPRKQASPEVSRRVSPLLEVRLQRAKGEGSSRALTGGRG